MSTTAPITSWGGLSSHGVAVADADLARAARDARMTRGLGRSYGDATLPVAGDRVASCVPADRILGFDHGSGALRAESGVPES